MIDDDDEIAPHDPSPSGPSSSGPMDHPGPTRAAPRSVSEEHLRGIVESLVFVSEKPIAPADVARIAHAETREVRKVLEQLREEYRGRGIQLDELNGGWQFRSAAANAPFVRELLQAKPVRLTRAQLETLAIIAYRQPVTRPEIDDVRGVDSGSGLRVLLERNLVRILGRKDEPGRPAIYGTTGHFLEFFALRSLRDLPTLREFAELSSESEKALESVADPDAPEESGPADAVAERGETPPANASADEDSREDDDAS